MGFGDKGFCLYEGTFFPFPPFMPGEQDDIPNPIRAIMYILGLGYLFLAVAIVSDCFMNGIEKITSAKKRVVDKATGRKVTVYVWNATVANLSLMALGSSAPEILLGLIEVTMDKFFLGPLGAGTIVGSAAFNLLCISAVCVAAIPDGEVRYIKEVHVYIITASCSVFAYVWLMMVVLIITPDVCHFAEAIVTFLFFPILVVLAYLADRGYFKKKSGGDGEEEHQEMTLADDATPEELAAVEEDIRKQYGPDLSDDQVVKIMRSQYFQKHSRAWYRHQAMQQKLHGSHSLENEKRKSEFTVQAALTSDTINQEKAMKEVKFGWASDTYSFLENVGKAKLTILRAGPLNCKAQVRYTTVEGTAKKGQDFTHVDEVIQFDKDQTEKDIFVEIKDDAKWESDEQFTVQLSDAQVLDAGSSCSAKVSASHAETTINIIDDDCPGEIRFATEEIEEGEDCNDHLVNVVVTRYNGTTGKISCKYYTEDMKGSKEGTDYDGIKGTLEFENGQRKAEIPINVKGRVRVGNATFNLVLEEPSDNTKFDAKTDGGAEKCICHITITHRDKADMFKKMMERVHSANAVAGHKNWAQQFKDALFQIVDDDDEEEEGEEGEPQEKQPPSKFDIFMHVISVPWKVLFAFIPPVDYCGGWACFCVALVFIGLVTMWVAEMANLVGCCLGLLPEENAITFVALGTSLPDTFASQAAAMMDPYADASIGNVTGSNSVNVFLGIGLAWGLAAFWWEFIPHENDDYSKEWVTRLAREKNDNVYGDKVYDSVLKWADPSKHEYVFMTPAGTIYFNLAVFVFNAFCAIQHLFARRKKWGGELGGPKKGMFGQYFSAAFLAGQWFFYVGASSIFARASGIALTYTDVANLG